MPSISGMSSSDVSGESESSASSSSTGITGPGPDNPPVPDSSDSSESSASPISVAELVGAVLVVLDKFSTVSAEDVRAPAVVLEEVPVVATEAENTAIALEDEGYISLTSEVSISTPS